MKVVGMARLSSDPELKSTKTGTQVCEFGIAYDTGYGENKKPCFVTCTAWGKTGEFIAKHFKKGHAIFIDGSLEMESWKDKSTGANRTKHKITVQQAGFTLRSSGDGKPSRSEDEAPADKPEDETVPF